MVVDVNEAEANEADEADESETNANNNQLGRADEIAGVANTADETK